MIIPTKSGISTPASGEHITGPGVTVGTNTVGDNVGVGDAGLGVIVVVALGMGVSVGRAVTLGTGF